MKEGSVSSDLTNTVSTHIHTQKPYGLISAIYGYMSKIIDESETMFAKYVTKGFQ